MYPSQSKQTKNVTTTQKLRAIGPVQLHRLLKISKELSSTLDLQELLELVLDVSVEITETEAASILLIDSETGELQFVATSDNPHLVGVTVPMKNSVAGWVVTNGESVILQDVAKDRRHYTTVDSITDLKTRSMLGVPMFAQEKVIGTLQVINKQRDEKYTPQDVTLLEALASQAAVAIANARLFQQSDVIAEVMHELKTPLMAVAASAELLAHPQLPEAQRQNIVSTIQREAKRLTKMTQDFLELSRLDSGRARLKHEPVDLVKVAEEVVEIQASQAGQKEIEIKIQHPKRKLPQTLGDADRLKQVLLNLVSNAIKYNYQGGKITIDVRKKNDKLHLSVMDTGPGISAEDLEHLFDRFYRVPGSEGYSEGTGLGLSIAQKILTAHKGYIEVDSELGKGTTFRCVLPIDGSGKH